MFIYVKWTPVSSGHSLSSGLQYLVDSVILSQYLVDTRCDSIFKLLLEIRFFFAISKIKKFAKLYETSLNPLASLNTRNHLSSTK